MTSFRSSILAATLALLFSASVTLADAPPLSDYCQRLQQEIQGKKHGFLAGNVTYYVGGFDASWEPKEHETLGLAGALVILTRSVREEASQDQFFLAHASGYENSATSKRVSEGPKSS